MSWLDGAFFAFFLAYLLLKKDCPFDACKWYRKKLDFKPFSCFFCLSVWIYCVTIFLYYTVAFASVWWANQILNFLGGLGAVTAIYVIFNNHAPNEYNND